MRATAAGCANPGLRDPATHPIRYGPAARVHGGGYLLIFFFKRLTRRWKEIRKMGRRSHGPHLRTVTNRCTDILGPAARTWTMAVAPIGELTWPARPIGQPKGRRLAGVDILDGATCRLRLVAGTPGLHARFDTRRWLCYNQIAAWGGRKRCAQGFQRVSRARYDMHHGQGIPENFYAPRELLYVSLTATRPTSIRAWQALPRKKDTAPADR